MAKKPSESETPETKPARKAVTRKPSVRKPAEAKKTADKPAPKTTKKKVATKEAPAVKELKVVSEENIKSPSAKKPGIKSRNNAKQHNNKKVEASAQEPKKESVSKVESSAAVSETVTKLVAPQQTQESAPAKQEYKKDQSGLKIHRESFKKSHRHENKDDRDKQEIMEFSPSDSQFAQPETVGGGVDSAFNKRKRRRRNKKGNHVAGEERAPQHDTNYRELDAKKVAKCAWKIFLSEITEEGLALVDDYTAREAARRSFRCAELFMIEEERRKHHHRQTKPAVSVDTTAPALADEENIDD